MSDRRPIYAIGLNVAVAAAYYATGWLGLQFPYYGEHVTLVWAPTAIALAAVVLAGPGAMPAIFLGSFGLNVTIEPTHPGPAALVALSNTLAPALAGLAMVRWYGFRPQFDRVRDAIAFLGVGVIATGVLTATAGGVSLCVFGAAPWRDFPTVWLAWIGGEAAGTVVVAPLILTWLTMPDPSVSKKAGFVELLGMVVAVAAFAASVVAYGNQVVALPFLVGPLLVWLVIRAGLRAATLAVGAVTLALVVGTALGSGPFIGRAPRTDMVSLWMSLVALGSATVVAGALLAERDRALHLQKRLLGELDHRVKNTLATVLALAERSSDDAVDVDDFRARFIGRVRAISRTHESLARSNWEPMKVADVVAETLAPFGGTGTDHLQVTGDAATIAPATVAPLTTVLHELATNAAKYGAWSENGGRVAVEWARTGDQSVSFHWREIGGPRLCAEPTPGYGLRLIDGIVSHELGGRAAIEFRDEGLVCTLDIPGEPNRKPTRALKE